MFTVLKHRIDTSDCIVLNRNEREKYHLFGFYHKFAIIDMVSLAFQRYSTVPQILLPELLKEKTTILHID